MEIAAEWTVDQSRGSNLGSFQANNDAFSGSAQGMLILLDYFHRNRGPDRRAVRDRLSALAASSPDGEDGMEIVSVKLDTCSYIRRIEYRRGTSRRFASSVRAIRGYKAHSK
jgi:hypothetical protein